MPAPSPPSSAAFEIVVVVPDHASGCSRRESRRSHRPRWPDQPAGHSGPRLVSCRFGCPMTLTSHMAGCDVCSSPCDSAWSNSATPGRDPRSANTPSARVGTAWLADHFMPTPTTRAPDARVLNRPRSWPPRCRACDRLDVAGKQFAIDVLASSGHHHHIDGGRSVLGIGAGGRRTTRRVRHRVLHREGRLDRLEEACAVITSLFANDRTNFSGQNTTKSPTRRSHRSPCRASAATRRWRWGEAHDANRRAVRGVNVWGDPRAHSEGFSTRAIATRSVAIEGDQTKRECVALSE